MSRSGGPPLWEAPSTPETPKRSASALPPDAPPTGASWFTTVEREVPSMKTRPRQSGPKAKTLPGIE
eukprot:3363190-Pyramimonas_sp.AAC.1